MEDAGEVNPVESDPKLLFRRQLQTCGGIIILPLVSSLTILRERRKMWEYKKLVANSFLRGMPLVGDLFGALLCGFSLYFIGRKKTLIITNVLFLLPSISLLAEADMMFNYFGVFALHFAIRFLLVAISIYIAEISHPEFRALFMGLYFLSDQLGIFVGYSLEGGSKVLNIFVFLLVTCALIHSTKIPETPYWLALTNRREEAEQVFKYLRGDTANEEAILTFDKAEIDAENKSLKNLISRPFYTPLILLSFMLLANNSMCFLIMPAPEPPPEELPETFTTTERINEFIVQKPITKRFLLEYLLPVFGSLSFLGLCLIASRRFLFLGSIVLSFSIFSIRTIDPYYLLCHLFQYMGAKQLTRIVPTELFPGPTRDIGLAVCDFLETLVLTIELYSAGRGSKNWLYNVVTRLRWVLIPMGFGFTFFYLPETKNLPLVDSEVLGNRLVLYFTFQKAPDEEIYE